MTPPAGPRLARWLFGILLPRERREFVLGDLDELHAVRVRRHGRTAADLRYWRDGLASVVASLRPAPGGPTAAAPPPPRRPPLTGRPDVLREAFSDLAATVRSLFRQPGFFVLATVTLALGVGSTAAVFGMVNQLLLRPLPGVHDPAGAAYLQLRSRETPEVTQGRGIALLDFDAIRREATLLDGIASYGRTSLHVAVGQERPAAVDANHVYGDFFGVLGVRAAEGRLLRDEDTRLEADSRVAVITPGLARTLFGPGEPAAGRTILANGEPVTVVGVAGGGFTGPERGDGVDVWIPHPALVPLHDFPLDRLADRSSVMHSDFVLRVREGADPSAAEAEIAAILAGVSAAQPESAEWLEALRPVIVPGLHVPPAWRDRTYGSIRLLAGVVGLVLLVACANVANLLLFRNLSRRGALATRRALGASTGRIARQRLVESLALATSGAALGLGVAWLVTLPFRGERLVRMPAFEGFAVDGRVLAFAFAISVATAVTFGAVPAVLAGRFDLGAALRDAGGRDTGRLGGLRLLAASGQIALSLTLVIGALLLARTVRNLNAVDTGFSIEGVATLPLETRGWTDDAAADALRRELLAAVTALPEVEGAALDLYGPHGSRMMGRVVRPDSPEGDAERAAMWPVTPGWFEMFEVQTVAGRPFRWSDLDGGGRQPVVLTAALARRVFGRTDVVGRRLRTAFHEWTEAEVVGVTRDLRSASSPEEPLDAFFVPFGSTPLSFFSLMVRTRGFDEVTAARVREAVEAVLPGQPVATPTLLSERVRGIHSERRIFSRLLGLLAALAIVLAAVGLYGVVAFTVAGRVREFGIRLALGAGRARIAVQVLRHAGLIVLSGGAFGVLGAWLLSSVLESRLFGVERLDPASYGLAVLLFGAVAALACWRPARAATRVDPIETLTVE